ncbi:hypothetical protein PJ985_10995 [Streptomyces sp. ACA25]|uniref:hypothetical protein n=1 Tax=Streptomyces sp. ACA25 TaxID=3022596 RepID=UPI002307C6B0|nr:hypothetical protein [Streptomyces sp. ACA25]MDB1088092.1 hypothetical protein [Streptomyces sp. ACA25]
MTSGTSEAERMRALAAPVTGLARLLDIRTFLLHAAILDVEAAEELREIEAVNTRLGVGRDGRNITCQFEHDFLVKGKNEVDALELKVNIGALFEFPAEHEPEGCITEENMVAFGQTTAQHAVHPYLRVAVSDLTSRLGCPRLTLGLLSD